MNVAFIPVRGGSKSIPLKNIKSICGKPLVYWCVMAACNCKYIDKVYVATDSRDIASVVEQIKHGTELDILQKLEVIGRSAESASDYASTEYAMLEFANDFEFDNIVLIQATSPLLQSCDLERGFEAFCVDGTDSVLSVVRQKRFNWTVDGNGFAQPDNYDVFNRPRRQEFDGYLVENGAFYITSRINLLKYKNRVSGNIRVVEMDESTYFEIDEPKDWEIIERLMQKQIVSFNSNTQKIKLFLTDCDGCLTDGGMYYTENGDELKKFNTKDGMGFSLLKEHGILAGVITGENMELNRRRAEKLKLDIYESGCKDKLEVIKGICAKKGFSLNDVCYVGDDLNDLETIRDVGFGCCPSDAVSEIRDVADYVAKAKGGDGVVREVIDLVLQSL